MANQRFQAALKHEVQNVPPIWFMRQAGRYHRDYQELKKQHSFIELCKNPDLAARVALGPVKDFDFDVAILFSDLLFPLEAMGMGLSYEGTGPQLGWHLNADSLKKLRTVGEALPSLEFQRAALQKTRALLPSDKSLIGFVGGPWTLFTYAVQGRHDGSLIEAKKNMRLFSSFCEVLMPLLAENIQLQIDGGAEVVMIFDTAAGELAPQPFKDMVVGRLLELARRYDKKLGYYSKGTTPFHFDETNLREHLAGLGFDHRWSLPSVLKEAAGGFTQGNFDQSLLFLEPPAFEPVLLQYLKTFQKLSGEQRAGWVCGLGHGVLPLTPEENVRSFIRMTREVFA